jgi:hypothetical protein
LAHADNDKRK